MKMTRVLATLALLAVLPTLPFAIYGYAGHDLRLHVTSWMEMRSAWEHGIFTPGWAALANYNLGDPHFSFYPPFSFAVGALLSLLLPFRLAPAAFVWVAIFLSGLSMYHASGFFAFSGDRLKAAILYMGSPYLLLTAINRFAAAELLTMAWLPLILLYFYQAVWLGQRKAMALLGSLLALSWLTNIPASIVLAYALFIVAAIHAIRQRAFSPVLFYLGASSIGAALAAFRLAPTFFERKWVSSASVLRYDFRNFFLFIPLSRLPLKGFELCCWLFACVEIVLIAVCAYSWRRQRLVKPAGEAFVHLAVVAFVFQLPISTFLWKSLPEFSFIGFPYRFLALLAAALPLVLLARNSPRALRGPAYVLMGLMALLPLLGYPRRGFQIEPRPYPRFAQAIAKFRQGYPGMPEFVPANTTKPDAPVHLPPIVAEAGETDSTCRVAVLSTASQVHVFSSTSVEPCRVRLALFFYPYWRAFDETGAKLATERTAAGLLSIRVPAGNHTVRVAFKAVSPLRTASAMVSIATTLLVVFLITGKPVPSGNSENLS